MEPNLFRYVWQHSRRDQIAILLVVLASLPFYFWSLDLPKKIVNDAIQGKLFQSQAAATIRAFDLSLPLPGFLGGGSLKIFDGIDVDRLGYLLGLSFLLFALVIVNGAFKYKINIAKGLIGERMLRRMRFDLFRQLLNFRPEEVRLIKPSEAASMIKDEVEPIGGFIGDAFIQPAFLLTQAGTALAFIVVQNVWLGLLTVLTVGVQAIIVPILRKKQLLLGKERQIASRKLAGKIGELVEGMSAVRSHGTQAYESAEVAGRLGNLFRIRFELYKRKFAVKYINNLLAQLTPFLFYTVGGYLALQGTLDVGQLVAVIAAYKDIPPPIKELIDWDQQRNDVTIKYDQILEQFAPQKPQEQDPPLGAEGARALATSLVVEGLTVGDGRGAIFLEGANVHLPLPLHAALTGAPGSGRESFARALGRQVTRYDGVIRVGDARLATLNATDATLLVAYAGGEPALFPGSIRENVAYGLRRRTPALETVGADDKAEAMRRLEARRTGNPAERSDDDWFDYALAGIPAMDGLDAAIMQALAVVGLADDVYRFGLAARIDPARDAHLAERLVIARGIIHDRLIAENKTRMIEPFDPEKYNSNASIGENLLFGVLVADGMTEASILGNTDTRDILREEGLAQPIGEIGARIAETMLEIFTGLPPGHPLFERFSFINAAELPEFEGIVERWRATRGAVDRLSGEFERLAVLALHYVEPRHRLGLLSEETRGKIVKARRRLHEVWRKSPRQLVEIYHPEEYCVAAPIRDNLLFGRIGFGVAGAQEAIAALIRAGLSEMDLDADIFRVGLDFQVGPGGRLLFANQRSGIDLARCLLRRPEMLVIDGALTGHRASDAMAIIERIRQTAQGRSVFADLPEGSPTEGFDAVLAFANGRLESVVQPNELEKADA